MTLDRPSLPARVAAPSLPRIRRTNFARLGTLSGAFDAVGMPQFALVLAFFKDVGAWPRELILPEFGG